MKKDSVAILNSLSRLTKERRIRGSRAFRNSITCSAKAISPGPTNRAERPARIQGRKMILAAVVDPASMLANAPAPSDGAALEPAQLSEPARRQRQASAFVTDKE
jgi:hypothetical protein